MPSRALGTRHTDLSLGYRLQQVAHKAAVASLWCGPGAPGEKPCKLGQTLDFSRAL